MQLRGAGLSADQACTLTGVARSTFYRRIKPPVLGPKPRGPVPVNALSEQERTRALALINTPVKAELSIGQAWFRLLDEGIYPCSLSTLYRIAREAGQCSDRRELATHPAFVKPELVATGPNQVWTWDITKIRGPGRTWFHLYVLIDVFSRYNPGWIIADREDMDLARDFIAAAVGRAAATPHTIHADRGSSMRSKTVAQLLVDLNITRSHSRPRVSNDNPFSEAQFKTLKYVSDFPDHFDNIYQARTFMDEFFAAYNHEHNHSGIGWHTPGSVHFGTHHKITTARQDTLDTAWHAHPERFTERPTPPRLENTVWINQPTEQPQGEPSQIP